MKPRDIAIYGAGGFAREVAWLVDACSIGREQYRTVCFVDDDPDKQGTLLNEIPVTALSEARQSYPDATLVVAVGLPQLRERLVAEARSLGFSFVSIIHPRIECSKWIEIGEGSVIAAGNILTTNIRLGKHVQINLDCTVGHDVVMDDYTTLAPGVHVSGWVQFGKRVYVGTGAVFINGTKSQPLTIGDDAVIGAGACVTKPVPPGETWGGVPAKLLECTKIQEGASKGGNIR
jgi:sugar O-acyltransferase (sialic acid O-acetyltransferase NeuD family)